MLAIVASCKDVAVSTEAVEQSIDSSFVLKDGRRKSSADSLEMMRVTRHADRR